MSSKSTRGRGVSDSVPTSQADVSASARLLSSRAAGDDSSHVTAAPTQHDLGPTEASSESVSAPRERASTKGSRACLMVMVVALVTQTLLASAYTCVLLFFDWEPHAPYHTAINITAFEWFIVVLIAMTFCDHTSACFHVALVVVFVTFASVEAALALGPVLTSCDTWKRAYSARPLLFGVWCNLLKVDRLQLFVLWTMLGGAFCAHLTMLIAILVAMHMSSGHKRAAENASSGRSSRKLDSHKSTEDNSASASASARSRSVNDDSVRTVAGGHLQCSSKASLALSSLPTAADVEPLNLTHEDATSAPHVRINIPPLSRARAFVVYDARAKNATGTALDGGYA